MLSKRFKNLKIFPMMFLCIFCYPATAFLFSILRTVWRLASKQFARCFVGISLVYEVLKRQIPICQLTDESHIKFKFNKQSI